MRKYELTENQAVVVHNLVKSHIAALHNWTASKVEAKDYEGAEKLIAELRQMQALFALTNVEAHKETDSYNVERECRYAFNAARTTNDFGNSFPGTIPAIKKYREIYPGADLLTAKRQIEEWRSNW